MITPSFSLTATERVLPSMALDFTTASLDSRVTFTRSGNTATVVNSSGDVANINADLPRFDFDPLALTCKGLLIEESRTNTNLYSEDLSNVVWAKIASTVSLLSVTTPSGGSSAYKLIADATNTVHYLDTGNFNTTAGTSYSKSLFVKAAEFSRIQMQFSPTGFTSAQLVTFDLVAKTATVNAGTPTATITEFKNGWFRCTMTAAATVTIVAVGNQIRLVNNSGSTSFAGNAVDGLFIWGVQIEAGAFPTSYIPTTASQVTHTADTATMTGTNFSSWYNASEGAFVASSVLSRQSNAGATAIFSANDNTAANLINCFYRASGALGSNIFAATVSQFDQTPLGVTAANTIVNIGVAYKLNDSVSYASGTIQTIDTTVTVPTVNQLQFGFTPTGAYLNGYVRSLRFYKQRILNAEGQAFSK